jgi:hypothetical protein
MRKRKLLLFIFLIVLTVISGVVIFVRSPKGTEYMLSKSSCNQNSPGREVISLVIKPVGVNTAFDDIKWERYTDTANKISFDYPKEYYITEKKTDSDDITYLISDCTNRIASINIVTKPDNITNLLSYLANPNQFKSPTAPTIKALDITLKDRPAKLIVDYAPSRVPVDLFAIPFADDSGNVNKLVLIYIPMADIEGYQRINAIMSKTDFIERYKNYQLKIAERILESVQFN